MSTHVLDTAEKYCDRFVLINDGSVSYEGSMNEIKQHFNDLGHSLNEIYLALAKKDDNHE